MKLRAVVLGLATLCTSTATFAGMVSTSSNLEFLAIDGQKASKSLGKAKTFTVDDTQSHQVVVRLNEIVGSGSNQSLFESNPVIVTFQGNAEDLVISAPAIRNLDSGDKFNQMPNITVKTKSGNAISAKVDVLKQEGLFPSANVLNDLAEYNASGAAASVSAFAATTSANSMVAVPAGNAKANKGKVVVQGENVAEQQLQYWFQQADKETQTRFLKWAKSHK
ncbi:TPA: curli polymerization inhibitor CsgI-related protein [Haemophilus influenzae]|uniref:curli polymerization inhibitor CsgI-related protein n=1 Tax=Haemophilus influenzae TaxID=727 RepID=UPI00014FCEF9|nr:DUF2057 domain-containing protein [Haemophilus influenzae]EDK07340.1 hypothetical protein CGSHiAA_03546 [Haemophilus influenzae PittAA]KPH67051.1 hypothetical protein AC246_09155 [Haemophilus influenzae]MCK8823040.1 DUF2057 domain-containing protein [Haemophilus influenzae]MCK8965047.1 DUF2057 domain-containing protein [Haemophilus influenzae]MCK8991650.1 DUF2057 domain-containing protein [Haemophilus influenzae]